MTVKFEGNEFDLQVIAKERLAAMYPLHTVTFKVM